MISASLEGPSTAPRISASLEGSEPTLERTNSSPPRSRAANLPRAGNSSPPRSRPPLGVRDKRPRRSTARRTEALNANHSSTVLRTDGVSPPFPTVVVTGVPSANSGHCSAIPDAVAALWNLRRGTRQARHCSHYYSANSSCPDSTSPHVRPRGRNQDKPVCDFVASCINHLGRGIRSIITSWCPTPSEDTHKSFVAK